MAEVPPESPVPDGAPASPTSWSELSWSELPWSELSWSQLLARFATLDRRRLWAAGAVALLAVGAATAAYALLRTPPLPATESTLPFAAGAGGGGGTGGAGGGTSAATAGTSTTAPAEVVVHAAGAVVTPGVHRLPAGSRVADLLSVAGGATADLDLDRVNLAAVLVDGERVWFPRIGEMAPPPVAGGSVAGGAGSSPAVAGPVSLNSATAEELEALPGIGPATAAAIVEHRDRHGPFRSVEDLLEVPGIGDAKLAQLRDLVTV